MGVLFDLRRLRIRQLGQMGTIEAGSLPREEGELPAEDSWRYQREGAPRVFALFGVVAGFLALVVPGLIALRSYRHWRVGAAEPTFAWSMAVIGALALPVVLLFTVLPIVAVVFGLLFGLPLLVLVGPRH